jgi:hypothetical protein
MNLNFAQFSQKREGRAEGAREGGRVISACVVTKFKETSISKAARKYT